MKKILFFILLSMSLTCFAQDSLNIDSKQTNGADSIHASHTPHFPVTHWKMPQKLKAIPHI